MKSRHVLYLAIIVGLLLPMSAIPVLADEGDTPMWVHQARLTYTGRSHWGPDALVALIHIRDDNLEAVSGALVTGVWTLPDGTVVSAEGAVTSVQGIAELAVFAGPGDYTICVTGVTKAGWEYDPEKNWDTCATFIMPPYKR